MATFTIKERHTELPVQDAEDIYLRLKPLAEADQVSFWLLGFDALRREIYRECVIKGGGNISYNDPKLIFKRIIACGASAWIGIVNHPSGILPPEDQEWDLVGRLEEVSALLEVRFLDFIIIADTGYFSCRERDFMGKNRTYWNWDPAGRDPAEYRGKFRQKLDSLANEMEFEIPDDHQVQPKAESGEMPA